MAHRREGRIRRSIELLLFTTDPDLATRTTGAGLGGVVVDLERRGKHRRQAGADTQINHDTVDDVRRVREHSPAHIVCRVNAVGPGTRNEIERVEAAGVDELLVPMVRRVSDVELVLDQVDGRCGVGILIETEAAVEAAAELAALPLSRIYVGLNDLAIERRSPNIFTAIVDGTVEHVREQVTVPFGFAGLTLPHAGSPIPCRLLIGELARLECGFTFLRRSFLRDAAGREAQAVATIKEAVRSAGPRSAEQTARERAELHETIRRWSPGSRAGKGFRGARA